MRRAALLIESARVKGHNPLPGAETDVVNLTRYLTSINGGAWEKSEIFPMSKPSVSDLLTAISRLESYCDYMFISFSGHGYMKEPSPYQFPPPAETSLTTVLLNDKEEITINNICPKIKNFLIIDSCREIEIAKSMKFMEAMGRIMIEDSQKRVLARQLFDSAIQSAGSGQIIAYSCGINKTAGEDPNRGGYFTASMIECGLSAKDHRAGTVLSTQKIFNCAVKSVNTLSPIQNPQYRPGRRLVHFPFAVSA